MTSALFVSSRRQASAVFAMVVVSAAVSSSQAAYRDLVGYDDLQTYLGAPNVPTAATVQFMQVEAQTDPNNGDTTYMPNYGAGDLTAKFFTNVSNTNNGVSNHANTVATQFAGNSTSIAPGIGSNAAFPILNYEANYFLNNVIKISGDPATTTARVISQSWIGSAGGNDATLLRRFDFTVNRDDVIEVVGVNNNTSNSNLSLLASAYNAITVGRSDGNNASYTDVAIDGVYTATRVAPVIVAPATTTSFATPMVAAGAALLIDAAKSTPSWSNGTYANRTRTITHGESSEVVKAVLMAGADRYVVNGGSIGDITTYTVSTANGLDHRYGAGQLNIFNSYRILEAGEQNSSQDGNANKISNLGWDYDNHFGGASGSNSTGSYFFDVSGTGSLIASLVWNLNVTDTNANPNTFTSNVAFYDLNLTLIDLTTASTVASSLSTTENTENIWFSGLLDGHSYELRVLANGNPFDFDYGLAWQINTTPIPEPASLAMLALGGLIVTRRRLVAR